MANCFALFLQELALQDTSKAPPVVEYNPDSWQLIDVRSLLACLASALLSLVLFATRWLIMVLTCVQRCASVGWYSSRRISTQSAALQAY